MSPRNATIVSPAAIKRAPRRQHERSAESDQRMVAAAIETLSERGINGLTIADVAQRAGYSHALIVQRYGSKAGLLARILDVVTEDWLVLHKKLTRDLVGLPALCAAVDAHIQFITERPEEIRAMYLLHFQAVDPSDEYQATVRAAQRAQQSGTNAKTWIAAGIKDGSIRPDVDVDIEAEMFSSLMAGLVYRWMANPHLPIRTLHEHAKAELVRNLGNPQSNFSPLRGKAKKKLPVKTATRKSL